VLTIAGLSGFGLLLGGLSLVFKRIGQLSSLVQFSLFFVAYAELGAIPAPWNSIVAHLPLARGVDLLKALLTPALDMTELGTGAAWLLADTAAYALAGSLFFVLMERVARRNGLLSHY
jgi:ABC-2 type transport system permease protein